MGVEFAIRHATTELIGSSPIPASIEAGIATAVPNPAIPSIKLPNPHPIISIMILLSPEMPASIFFIKSIAPVLSVRLYVKRAAIITRHIGHNAFRVPSSTAVEMFNTFILQYEKASAIVTSSAIPQALWLGILSLPSDNMSHAIGSMASAKFKNNMTDSLSKSIMIASTIADLECPIQRFLKTGEFGYYDSYKQSKPNIVFSHLKQGDCRHNQIIPSFEKLL